MIDEVRESFNKYLIVKDLFRNDREALNRTRDDFYSKLKIYLGKHGIDKFVGHIIDIHFINECKVREEIILPKQNVFDPELYDVITHCKKNTNTLIDIGVLTCLRCYNYEELNSRVS